MHVAMSVCGNPRRGNPFAARIPGLGVPVQFGMRSLIARVAAALAREAERTGH